MGIIKVMDQSLSNKIAAGEVVESVASVVKELVENSIDACSTNIIVELLLSGTKQIKVTDNGTGMEEDDALLSFTPHATSKIKSENDLFFINTLGFRGEALASVSSVTDTFLTTSKDNVGVCIHIKGGNFISKTKVPRSKGTTVEVNNLFFNTPARLKFLKSLNTELNNVVFYIEKLSLSHTNISFTLISEQKEILKTSGSCDTLKTIHEIYGPSVSKNMINIIGENDDYSIKGYISNISVFKSNKNFLNIIVNDRVVNNAFVNNIIKDAYHTFLPENRYPVVVLYIDTDPTLIDVNIHPTKQDIKFSKLSSLENVLYNTLRDKLSIVNNTFNAYNGTTTNDNSTFIVEENTSNSDEYLFNDEDINIGQMEIFDEKKDDSTLINPLGLAMGTYLFANDKENIYIIDIHAANERINYEKVLKALKEKDISYIDLLIPITIEYSLHEFMKIKELLPFISSLGIKTEEFGINTIRILSHPTWIKEGYEESTIRTILDMIIVEGKNFDRIKFNDKLSSTIACKMSVKANSDINDEEKMMLIKRLFQCDFPYTCPHGRPTIIKYTKYDLEVLFKRVNA
ncbi:MAG: DNA mismatch repair endonuclease MutL [Bacilli bacterium]